MKRYQLILFILILSTASIAQDSIDAVLSSFKAALAESDQGHQDTFYVYKSRYAQQWSACQSRIRFYKTYSNFHYSNERDDLVLVMQKDSILPLQQRCLVPNHDAITTTLLNVARSYHYLTEYNGEDYLEEAEAYYLMVSELQAKNDSITKYYSKRYKDIAEFYNYIKDYKKAALYYERAMNIYVGEKKSRPYIKILTGSSDCLIEGKKYHEAIGILENAVQLVQKDPNKFSGELSLCYDRMAKCYEFLNQYYQAESYIIKARKIESVQGNGDLHNAITFANRHAHILKLWGKHDKAYSVYLEVKELIKTSGDNVTIEDISGINEDLAGVFYAKSDFNTAIDLYHKGISELVSSCPSEVLRNPPIVGNQIFNLQYLQRQLGLKARAMLKLGEASPDESLYAGALDAILKFDSLGIELLKQNWEEASHQIRINELNPFYKIGIQSALELYKLKNDTDYLATAHQLSSRFKSQLLHRGIAIKETKKTVLTDAQLEMESGLKDNISKFETAYLMDMAADQATAESLKNYLDEKAKLDKFHLDHKVSDIIDNSLSQTSITTAELRSKLAEQTALLEYFVSPETIYAFLITADQIQFQQLNTADLKLDSYFEYLVSGEGLNPSARVHSLINILTTIDREKIKNLIIIPDQQLLQIPFETLQLNGKYLLDQFSISYQYSTSFFANERTELTKSEYLGFASDYSSTSKNSKAQFTSLPYAVEEINTARNLFGGKTFVNQKATKSKFEANCENAGLLHLALHTKLNDQYPDQSALIFQVDSSYENLTASEIYNFDLNTNLTVLSACNTAVGQINPGDGVRSITRSFIHAGSASVLTTLWEAPDVSTSQIINSFYNELKAGSPKDAALRTAKLEYINSVQPSFRHPRYWAHLVLVGDITSIQQSHFKKHSKKVLLALVFLGLILLSIYFLKSK